MMSRTPSRCKVGELRPSQVLTTFGIGAIIDLPNISVMVMGLDDWPMRDTVEIGEERLLASVREALGPQVQALRSAPVPPEPTPGLPLGAGALVGIPVASFPRWMVCPACRRLASLSSGLLTLETSYRTDQIRYVHANCASPGRRRPTVIPARFIVACPNGHVDDFPWREFVHRGPTDCLGGLRLFELTATGEAAGIEVRCEGAQCGASRRMSDAFKTDPSPLPLCRGRRPQLRDFEEESCQGVDGKTMHLRAMLQGASNSWFALTLSALAIPQASSELAQRVEEQWTILEKVQSVQNIELLQQIMQLRDLAAYTPVQIWEAVQAKKAQTSAENADASDLKTPEWQVFTDPQSAEHSRDFQLRVVPPPDRYAPFFEQIVLAERLREVRALVGFTRIESPSDYDNPAAFPAEQRAKIARIPPTWVPASEIRGEGIFFQFNATAIQQWLARVKPSDALFYEAHQRWRRARGLEPAHDYYPGLRYVLLHSFAHSVIRQLAVECGYTAAALRERIYARGPGGQVPEMAGVLIYTAAPDSEGTLGGLVSLGEPATLERHLDQALDAMRLCASDPLCAEHHPYRDGITLHAASCHACLFAPETSCERGNKYLDRAVLVPTVERADVVFFEPQA
jgi:hypothetical protein